MLFSRFRAGSKKNKNADSKKDADRSKTASGADKFWAELNTFLQKRDYAGAVSLLSQYTNLLDNDKSSNNELNLYLACCQYFMGMYDEAGDNAERGPKNALQNRILLHIAHRMQEEEKLMHHHTQLQDVLEDQLCLAGVHYLRGHYQEAIDIYKRVLLGNKAFIALNVYLAMCYYKLDFYDVSLEVLAVYLQANADSTAAVNLKACNHYKLFSGKSAQAELKTLEGQIGGAVQYGKDLIEHNRVVFGGGERALAVLPRLLDVIPEARPNLIIYHLRSSGELDAAYALCTEMRQQSESAANIDNNAPKLNEDSAQRHMPSTELMLYAIVHCLLAQKNKSKEHLNTAQEYFRMVGSSPGECDTIAGRQCMASALFLARQFDDVLTYLESIKNFFYNDDTFNYNYAQALTAVGKYAEAEAAWGLVQQPTMANSLTHLCTLARCYIMNGKAKLAWNLYLQSEANSDSFTLLQLIANDCYRCGQFYHSARAFDVLERLDGGSVDAWKGKQAACCGAFAVVVRDTHAVGAYDKGKTNVLHAQQEQLRDVLSMLSATSHPQVEAMVRTMKTWAKENNFPV